MALLGFVGLIQLETEMYPTALDMLSVPIHMKSEDIEDVRMKPGLTTHPVGISEKLPRAGYR